ncbi:MAG: hypothetical protein H0U95_11670 [Bacteroidetes bacterium]|nr:hypothetical protein [Bacteroidota bacterium]
MNKIKLVVCWIFILSTTLSFAQDKKKNSNTLSGSGNGSACFNESSHVLNVGIGFGTRGYYHYTRGYGYSYHSGPMFSLSYEQALPKKIGPGYLGVGAYLGYQHAYLEFDNYYYNGNQYYYRHNWRYMLIAARAAYHLDILNSEKAELYFGAIIGIRYQSYSYETNSIDPNKNLYELRSNSIYPVGSLFVGGRWYFVPKVALFGEIGYGTSYLTLGVSFKL